MNINEDLSKLGAYGEDYLFTASRDGDKYCILLGKDLQEGVGGFGDTVPEALRDLADNLEKTEIKLC